MYPYVKCPSCGNLIGHLYPLFKAMRALKNEKEQTDLIDVYEILGISSYCCKTRLMSSKEFNEFLHSE